MGIKGTSTDRYRDIHNIKNLKKYIQKGVDVGALDIEVRDEN